MDECYFNLFWFKHYIRLTKRGKFEILGKVDGQWINKLELINKAHLIWCLIDAVIYAYALIVTLLLLIAKG